MKFASLILVVSMAVAMGGDILQIDGKPVEIVKTGEYSPEAVSDKLAKQAYADSLLPVRRSFEDGQVFWNAWALRLRCRLPHGMTAALWSIYPVRIWAL